MKIQDDQLVFDTGKVLDRMFKNPGLDLDWQDTGEPLECTLGPDDFFHKNGPEHNASRPFSIQRRSQRLQFGLDFLPVLFVKQCQTLSEKFILGSKQKYR